MQRPNESGVILVLCIIIVLVFSVIGLGIARTAAAQYVSYSQRLNAENAIAAADAGITASIVQLNKNRTTFTGLTEQTLYSDTSRGRATFEVTMSADANDNKFLTSTGKVYKSVGDTTPINTKVIKATAALKREKISNSVIFGSGGLWLDTNARINKGNVYVRGQVNMYGGSGLGTVSTPVLFNSANIGCETTTSPSNWPQPCGAANPPIKMYGAGGTIYGDVCATNQVVSTGIVGTLRPNCTSEVITAPSFNKKAFIESINASGGPVVAASSIVCPAFGGTLVIAPNTKINGNVSLSSFGTCNIYVEGDIYVTGSLIFGNNVNFMVSDNLGTTRPTIVVNRDLGSNGNSRILRNAVGTPMFLITFVSTNTACSSNETVPSDTVQTCLTSEEARNSAVPPLNVGGSSPITIDMTGAIFYIYYSYFSVLSTNLTWAFYAFGAQGGLVAAGSQISTVADDAPFGDLLYIPKYRLIEYRQI